MTGLGGTDSVECSDLMLTSMAGAAVGELAMVRSTEGEEDSLEKGWPAVTI